MGAGSTAKAALAEGLERLSAALGPAGAPLRPALARLDWATVLPNAAAPGFVYLAGSYRGVAVGGGGATLAEAAARLAGEAAEVLALYAEHEAADRAAPAPLAALWGDGPTVAAETAPEGRPAAVPRAAVDARAPLPPGAPPRSVGLAAGPDRAAARLGGLLELVERDAAAAWWGGHASPRAPAVEDAAAAGATLARLRGGATARRSAFLLLPARAGVPVACAWSQGAAGGGLALGLKAADTSAAALDGAMREMLQMEIGLKIARLRVARGAPAPGDAVPLGLAALDPAAFAAFRADPPGPAARPAFDDFADLAARLGRAGVEAIVADLPSVPDGPAVAKVFAPALVPLPGPDPAPRPDAPGARAELIA